MRKEHIEAVISEAPPASSEDRSAWGEFLCSASVLRVLGELEKEARARDGLAGRSLFTEEDVRKALHAQGEVEGMRRALQLLIDLGADDYV